MHGTKRYGSIDKGQFVEMQISQEGLQFWEHSLGKEIVAPERETCIQFASEYHAA